MRPVEACQAAIQQAGLQARTAQVDSDQPAGTFLGTDPGAGSRIDAGQTVTILVSNGAAVPAPPAGGGNGGPGGGGGDGDQGRGND